jgi:hypothetical protein
MAVHNQNIARWPMLWGGTVVYRYKQCVVSLRGCVNNAGILSCCRRNMSDSTTRRDTYAIVGGELATTDQHICDYADL